MALFGYRSTDPNPLGAFGSGLNDLLDARAAAAAAGAAPAAAATDDEGPGDQPAATDEDDLGGYTYDPAEHVPEQEVDEGDDQGAAPDPYAAAVAPLLTRRPHAPLLAPSLTRAPTTTREALRQGITWAIPALLGALAFKAGPNQGAHFIQGISSGVDDLRRRRSQDELLDQRDQELQRRTMDTVARLSLAQQAGSLQRTRAQREALDSLLTKGSDMDPEDWQTYVSAVAPTYAKLGIDLSAIRDRPAPGFQKKLRAEAQTELQRYMAQATAQGVDFTKPGVLDRWLDGTAAPFRGKRNVPLRAIADIAGMPVLPTGLPRKETPRDYSDYFAERVRAKEAQLGRPLTDTERSDLDLTENARYTTARRKAESAGLQDGVGDYYGMPQDDAKQARRDLVILEAAKYRVSNKLPSFRGAKADKLKEAIMLEAARQSKLVDKSPAAALQRAAVSQSDRKALDFIQRASAAAEASEHRALEQIDLVREIAAKVPRTQFPIINDIVLSGKSRLLGDKNVDSLTNALITFTTEYAKIMSGATTSAAGATEGTRQEATHLINRAMNNGSLNQQLDIMEREMDMTMRGYDASRQTLLEGAAGGAGVGWSGQLEPAPVAPPTTPVPSHAPAPADVRRSGRRMPTKTERRVINGVLSEWDGAVWRKVLVP